MIKRKKRSEPFVMLPLSLLTSPAWRALSVNAKRFVEFLMIEHMRHGGQHNGRLLAPRRQLWDFGIGHHFVSEAIEEAERFGLVDCRRGFGRHPSTYSLTWLPLGDGTPPSNRFLNCAEIAESVVAERKAAKTRESSKKALVVRAKQHSLRMSAVCLKYECQRALTRPAVSVKQHSLQGSAKQHSLSRISFHGEAEEIRETVDREAMVNCGLDRMGTRDPPRADTSILASPAVGLKPPPVPLHLSNRAIPTGYLPRFR
jgi:hypothetical protein